MLNLSMDKEKLVHYVCQQLNYYFPDEDLSAFGVISQCIDYTLARVKYCFSHINDKHYGETQENSCFNHLNGDHYAMFLYLLSNTVWQNISDENIATKLFLLNKALHGIDAFYQVSLPDIFLFVHPLGTVLGRASYSDYFVVYQGCTVGAVEGSGYPTFSKRLVMYSNSSILGNCHIGENVTFGANSYIVNKSIEKDCVVVGQHPNVILIPSDDRLIDGMFY